MHLSIPIPKGKKMSWLARSLVNTFKGEEDDDESEGENENSKKSPNNEEEQEGEEDPTRGVKEDLSELTKTLSRQFWGVASFLAPPPSDQAQSSHPTVDDESEALNSPRLAGIRSDFAEIGGRFKSGISMLSSTKAVSEISKIASNFLPFRSDEDEEDKCEGEGVAVSEEIIAFARNVSMHPETWLDFPAIPDEFDMSDAQQEHVLAVERLAPSLASLRIQLCRSHMSEGRFWKIYFVLLYSRLNRQDADLFTTPQIVQARALLLQDLPHPQKPTSEGSDRGATAPSKQLVASVPPEENIVNTPAFYDDDLSTCIPITDVETEENIVSSLDGSIRTSSSDTLSYDDEHSAPIPITDVETKKHPVQSIEVKIIDKSVIEEEPPKVQPESNTISIQELEEDIDDWLEEDNDDEEEKAEAIGSKGTVMPVGNEEDVSFSDLEEEDDDDQGTSRTPKP